MSTNTDTTFSGVAVAVAIQSSGFGSPDGTIAGLTTPLTLASGVVLGDAESGDAESGITIPNIVGVHRSVAVVAASFTESADAFQKAEVNGFSISWIMQGNGVTAANPISTNAGEAEVEDTIPGMDAIFQSAGLEAADGTTPVVEYTPSASANIYTTWKLWHGDLAFVFSDCLVESLTFEFTPGGFCIVTANVAVGTFDHTTAVDGFTFPTIDYEEMASLTGPTVENVAFDWYETHGFENLTVTIAAEIAKFGDSNVATTGERQSFTKRVISVNGTLYVEATTSDAHFTNLKGTTAPIEDIVFQVGTVTIADAIYNSFKMEVNNLQAKDIKYNRIGTALVVELNDAKATATTAGAEFMLTLN